MIDSELTTENDFTLRFAMPGNKQAVRKVLLLLHGWTGDENSMWVFIRRPSANTLIIAPRGPVAAEPGGFGWVHHASEGLATPLGNYLSAVESLLIMVENWLKKRDFYLPPFEIMGFSQGAAVAGILASLYPERFIKTAMLAGFLPPGLTNNLSQESLKERYFFIAHGRNDEIIPYNLAEKSVASLQSAGADVTFCPSDAGHKLSLDCVKDLENFLDI